jgi:asparagine synthase (glutamine-hydrolysing)
MCGIVGKIHFDRHLPVDREEIEKMAEAVLHRGPDDHGAWVQNNVGLAHRRLSIIDLSSSGRNPMCNEDGTVWIVFNGEIYNFQELRPLLEARGHRFRSHTDTEVILHSYEEFGDDCVRHFRGMFAFALWDCRKRRLLLARDRLGVKPLFYTATSRGLLFGSELKAILSSGDVDPLPDPTSIHQFLLWQCIHSPRTGFQGIHKLQPASVLIWQEGGVLEVKKYWQLDYSQPWTAPAPELTEHVRSLIDEATRIRLVADVPLGLFLSGGIDSACVLAAARKSVPGKIKTFSVAFGHQDFDESPYSRQLAKHFDTDHHELQVTPDALQLLPRMAKFFDEPFADSSAIPTYYLCNYTSQHVTVALSGDGGDEAFGGYDRYLALKGLQALARVPGSRLLPYLRGILPNRPTGRSKSRYLHELLKVLHYDAREQYRIIFLGMMEADRWTATYSQDFRRLVNGAGEGDFLYGWDTPSVPDYLTRAMAADTMSYIPEDLNVKVDICSMACSLEVRSPFLDHKLVEFCARIPSTHKIHGTTQKHILKHAFRTELPKEIIQRGKAGFAVPISAWFRGELKEFARDTLLSAHSHTGDVFDREKVRMMLEEHASGKRNWHSQLWRVLILENWFQAQAARARDAVPA